MVNKIFVMLFLFFSFVITCQSQDTLKVVDSTNQDSTTTEDDSVTYTLVENCKCNYVKIPLINIPKNLYEDDIDIVVWSYEPTYYSRIITPAKDTLWSLWWSGGIIKDGIFYYGNSDYYSASEKSYTKGKESVKLSKKQKKKLSKLLHQYQVIEGYCPQDELMCYQPRHAILFYKDNKVIDFLEVCLECQKFRFSNPSFSEIFHCREKYDLLKTFFRKIGIKFYLEDKYKVSSSEIRKRR